MALPFSAILSCLVNLAYGASFLSLLLAHPKLQGHVVDAIPMVFLGCATLSFMGA